MSSFANCSNFSETQLTILTGLRGGVSAALSLASVILLIVTCACQSKLKFGRRDRSFKITLFALFGVSTCYLTVLSLGVVYHLIHSTSSARKWCAAFGFFNQILSVTQTTLLFINTNPIVALLFSEITRGHNLEEWRKNCIVWGIMSSIIVLAAMILISSFVPFINETYGEECVWCWIIRIDKECKVAGFWERMFLFTVYQALISLLCIVMILTSLILFLKACAYKIRIRRNRTLNDRHDYKHLFSKYIFQLVILIPIFCEYAVGVAELHTHHYSFLLWVYYAIAPPISGFLIPLSFLFYLKFGYAESRGSSPHITNNKSQERVHNATADELRNPSINVITFISETTDYYHTCLDHTLLTWPSKNRNVQAENQHLLENHCNTCYSS